MNINGIKKEKRSYFLGASWDNWISSKLYTFQFEYLKKIRGGKGNT
jgi:hypothetical protein